MFEGYCPHDDTNIHPSRCQCHMSTHSENPHSPAVICPLHSSVWGSALPPSATTTLPDTQPPLWPASKPFLSLDQSGLLHEQLYTQLPPCTEPSILFQTLRIKVQISGMNKVLCGLHPVSAIPCPPTHTQVHLALLSTDLLCGSASSLISLFLFALGYFNLHLY